MLLMRSTTTKRRNKFPSLLYCCASSWFCQPPTTTTAFTRTTSSTFATVATTPAFVSSSFDTNWKTSSSSRSSPFSFHSNRHRAISSTTKMASLSSKSDDIIGKTLISVDDAIQLCNDDEEKKVKFIDGSWFLKGRNGREEFIKGPRIVGAQYFDIDDISSPSHLPHMMPSKSLFASTMDAMNISNDDHIIVYGSKDCMFVHRAWFQIRNMGHGQDYCHLLDGSIGDWINSNGPIEKEGTQPSMPIINAKDLDLSKQTNYQAMDAMNIIDLDEMKELVSSKVNDKDVDAIWIDARSKDRFLGKVEEPRPGMRLGHMPGAKNVFFLDLLDTDNNNVNKLKPKSELQKFFDDALIDTSTTDKRMIVSCGSGATACTVVAALELCGVPTDQCFVYDGSWSEWGALDDTPIVK